MFVELQCEQFEVPVGGEAIVRLADGRPHSIDVEDAWITVWDECGDASVEVISSSDKRIDEALSLVRVWLHRFGAETDALVLHNAVEDLEPSIGYFTARDRVFRAFHGGFSGGEVKAPMDGASAACWRAGVTTARLNAAARETRMFPELDAAPFDTDTARTAFKRALSDGS